jgi:outer membrane protein OmpA-like peptidoglycan-associated protein
VEQFDLSADALFKFDRGDLGGMLPQGKAKLDELAARLNQAYANVDSIRLVGHADRLGGDAYNQKLSEQRAWTVKQYLQQRGITAAIQTEGRGEAEPTGTTTSCKGERAIAALTQCLQPDRRVSVEIVGARRTPQ